MEPVAIEKKSDNGEEQYELTFRNGALANLKQLASALGVPDNDLKQVINKGIKLLTITKDAKQLIFEDQAGDRFRIDIKKL